MKSIKVILTIFFVICAGACYSQIPLNNMEVNLKVQHDGVTFSKEIELPASQDVEFTVPNVDSLKTNSVEIILPDGSVINETNAGTFSANYILHDPSNAYETLLGPYKSWKIRLKDAPAGTYSIIGNVTGTLDLPINVTIYDSKIKYFVKIGEITKNITQAKWMPISIFLIDDNGVYQQATVDYKIYKDDILVGSKSIKDDGNNTDVVASDGLYTMLFKPSEAGTYTVKATISDTDSSNVDFVSNIAANFVALEPSIEVDENYSEETKDTDADGYFDELIINFPILVSHVTDGHFDVYAKIKASNGEVVDEYQRIEVSENKLYVRFSGKELRALNYDGVYEVVKFQINYNDRFVQSFDKLRNTASYSHDVWERDNLLYEDNFMEEAIDLNEDGFYDQIKVTFDIDSILPGEYGLSTQAFSDENQKTKVIGIPSFEVSNGVNTIELLVSSEEFVAFGEDTKLTFSNLFIYPNFSADSILEVETVGITKEYSCWQFAGCESGPNNAPEAVDDFAASNGSSIYINAAENDVDADGDLLKVNSVTQPSNGLAEIVGNSVQYTPNEGFSGEDTFTYEILDIYPENNVWKRGSDIGNITVTVTNNLPPIANDDAYAIPINGESQLNVLNNDSDPDGDNLYITETTAPQNGTITNYGNLIVYSANDGFEGQDSFEYTIIDVDPESNVAKDGTDTAVVTLNVGAVSNSPPVANDDEYSVNAGVEVTLDVVANDGDPDGDSVFVVEYTVPNQGSLEFIDNKAVYTAYSDAQGFDGFKYTITDTKGGYSQASVLINIINDSVNYPPVANDDNAATTINAAVTIPVLANDSDPENEVLTIVSVGEPTTGNTLIENNQIKYTPALDYTGEDNFIYTISDESGNESTASVIVTISGTNQPPIAADDSVTTLRNQSISIDVLGNDSDPDNDNVSISSVTSPASGTAEISGNNIIYTPNVDYVGNDTFTYTISDGKDSSSANVNVIIEDGNESPVAVDDSYTIVQGETVLLDVLNNDNDANADVLTIIDVTQPEYGDAIIENNKVKYVSDNAYTGSVSFTYTISDGELTSTADVTLTIEEKTDSAPSLQIISPEDGDIYSSNVSITLLAEAIDDEDGELENIYWESSLDGAIGVGSELAIELSPGQHVIQALVTDSAENSVSSQVVINVSNNSVTEYRNDTDYNIPDNKGYGVASNIQVTNSHLTSKIQVKATISHSSLADIGVQLIGPTGKRYNLSNPGRYSAGENWIVNFNKETDIQGIWVLKVSDQKINEVGKLTSWGIIVE